MVPLLETGHQEEQDLQGALQQYLTDIFTDLRTVKSNVTQSGDWLQELEEEEKKLIKINRDDPKTKNFLKYLLPCDTTKKETRLTEVLENIMTSLEKPRSFMEALERLAVTSEHVLELSSQLQVSVDLRSVGKVLSVVRAVAPWLLMFKGNHTKFSTENSENIELLPLLSPKLQNIEPLELQLQVYITALRSMCRPLQDRSTCQKNYLKSKEHNDLTHPRASTAQVRTRGAGKGADRGVMYTRVFTDQCLCFRMNKSFRLQFLLKDKDQTFISEFREREPEMQKCLDDLEKCAVNLDWLICSGVSTVISLITLIADVYVNFCQRSNAHMCLEKFEDYVRGLQRYLNSSIMVDIITQQFSAEKPDILTVALKGSQSKFSLFGFITNSVFISIDVVFFILYLIDLCKKSRPAVSEWIRARASLLTVELNVWKNICNDLKSGQPHAQRNIPLLQTAFSQ
ncbi:hypothetical protein WMY93_032643 [Mugilogobius chulae]|uniref:Uncharacterized protein n=1 Tax=Mugilogobius chulae TaxID=88201 RepID=A0AAW0MQX0_9GOBI